MEDIGPAQSATTTDQKDHADEFAATDFDGNDLTGGNLKMLTRSLKALTRDEDKPEDTDLALDVRPTLVQASNLLVEVISLCSEDNVAHSSESFSRIFKDLHEDL